MLEPFTFRLCESTPISITHVWDAHTCMYMHVHVVHYTYVMGAGAKLACTSFNYYYFNTVIIILLSKYKGISVLTYAIAMHTTLTTQHFTNLKMALRCKRNTLNLISFGIKTGTSTGCTSHPWLTVTTSTWFSTHSTLRSSVYLMHINHSLLVYTTVRGKKFRRFKFLRIQKFPLHEF